MNEPRPGAMRHTREDGTQAVANPRDPLYSTLTMVAQEYYDGKQWAPIWPDDEAVEAAE